MSRCCPYVSSSMAVRVMVTSGRRADDSLAQIDFEFLFSGFHFYHERRLPNRRVLLRHAGWLLHGLLGASFLVEVVSPALPRRPVQQHPHVGNHDTVPTYDRPRSLIRAQECEAAIFVGRANG